MSDVIPEGCIPLAEVRRLYLDQLWSGGTPVDELRQRVRGKDILPDVARDHLERLKRLENLEWQGLLQPFFQGRLEALVRMPGRTGNFTIPKSAWAEMFYPERPFLAAEIAPGHGEYWGSIVGCTPFVRQSQAKDWLSNTDATIVKLMGPKPQLHDLAREIMLGLAQDGLVRPDELEGMAKRWGQPPLQEAPDSSRFNPLEEAVWTLPMVLAWLVWRTPEAVRDEWDLYRTKCWHWQSFSRRLPVNGGTSWREVHGHELVDRRRASVRELSLAEAFDEANGETEFCMSVKSAREVLWNSLAASVLAANATDADGNVVTIPPREWAYLELAHTLDGPDYLINRQHSLQPAYMNLTFARQDVVRLWKPLTRAKVGSAGEPFEYPHQDRFWPLIAACIWIGAEGQSLTTAQIADVALDEAGAGRLFEALNQSHRHEPRSGPRRDSCHLLGDGHA